MSNSSTEKRYWFRAIKTGWSWGLPLVWQGWVAWLIFGIVMYFNLVYVHDINETLYWVVLAFSAIGMLVLHIFKGEPPRKL